MAAAAGLAMILPALLAAAAAPNSPQDGHAPRQALMEPRTPVLALPAEPRKGLSFRIAEEIEPDGTIRLRRGIVAGFEVAPDALVGIGLFETMPKRTIRSEENNFEHMPKRRRKAAVGLSLRF